MVRLLRARGLLFRFESRRADPSKRDRRNFPDPGGSDTTVNPITPELLETMPEAKSGAVRKSPLIKLGPRRGKARRSTIACVTCRLRKVRCDVMTGAPCANCRVDKCGMVVN